MFERRRHQRRGVIEHHLDLGHALRHHPIAVRRRRTSSTASSPHRRQPARHPPWPRLAASSLPVRSCIPTEEDDENLQPSRRRHPILVRPRPLHSTSYPVQAVGGSPVEIFAHCSRTEILQVRARQSICVLSLHLILLKMHHV
jgi:hypothetical protein